MTVVRRLFFHIGPVPGVPRVLYWLRRRTFPRRIVSSQTPDGIPITIDREDYGQVALVYYDYCPEIKALLRDAMWGRLVACRLMFNRPTCDKAKVAGRLRSAGRLPACPTT